MKKRIITALLAFMAVFQLGVGLVLSPSVGAVDKTAVCDGIGQIGGNKTDCNGTTNSSDSLTSIVKNIINVLLFIVGSLAVIMIIYSGIRYVTSTGDQSRITAAKNTLMYSIVGLIVAILAFAIVNFVVVNIK